MNVNELLVQWWESERRIPVWLGPGKHKNAINTILNEKNKQVNV